LPVLKSASDTAAAAWHLRLWALGLLGRPHPSPEGSAVLAAARAWLCEPDSAYARTRKAVSGSGNKASSSCSCACGARATNSIRCAWTSHAQLCARVQAANASASRAARTAAAFAWAIAALAA